MIAELPVIGYGVFRVFNVIAFPPTFSVVLYFCAKNPSNNWRSSTGRILLNIRTSPTPPSYHLLVNEFEPVYVFGESVRAPIRIWAGVKFAVGALPIAVGPTALLLL